jgi:hypothetical protein
MEQKRYFYQKFRQSSTIEPPLAVVAKVPKLLQDQSLKNAEPARELDI